MTQETFNKAFCSLDEKMLEEHIRYGKKLKTRRTATRIAAAAASFVMILSLSIGVFAKSNYSGTPQAPGVTEMPNESEKIIVSPGESKQTTYVKDGAISTRISLECYKQSPKDSDIVLKVGMNDAYTMYQGLDGYKSYDEYSETEKPVFTVENREWNNDPAIYFLDMKRDSGLKINGEPVDCYVRPFSLDEMKELDRGYYWSEDRYHYEDVHLDFSDTEDGRGMILLTFGWRVFDGEEWKRDESMNTIGEYWELRLYYKVEGETVEFSLIHEMFEDDDPNGWKLVTSSGSKEEEGSSERISTSKIKRPTYP